ncbi:hypothetical protein DFH06DRAFT_1235288 [Mycena polygramma]|nr:hypothetical protein DFH06DRAFT_1235288 [Mycena polygramma]
MRCFTCPVCPRRLLLACLLVRGLLHLYTFSPSTYWDSESASNVAARLSFCNASTLREHGSCRCGGSQPWP